MLAKCPTNLKFLSSLMKLQQMNGGQCLKPALFLCTGELCVRFAGHSKWQNIRHTKAAKDRMKAIVFSRIIRDIERAAASKLQRFYLGDQNSGTLKCSIPLCRRFSRSETEFRFS